MYSSDGARSEVMVEEMAVGGKRLVLEGHGITSLEAEEHMYGVNAASAAAAAAAAAVAREECAAGGGSSTGGGSSSRADSFLSEDDGPTCFEAVVANGSTGVESGHGLERRNIGEEAVSPGLSDATEVCVGIFVRLCFVLLHRPKKRRPSQVRLKTRNGSKGHDLRPRCVAVVVDGVARHLNGVAFRCAM